MGTSARQTAGLTQLQEPPISRIVFLNELAFGTAPDRWAADQAMAAFIKALQTLAELHTDTSVVDHLGLKSMDLAPGYNCGQWMSDPKNEKARKYLRALQSKAPFRQPQIPDDIGFSYDGLSVDGLGYASFYEGLCASLDYDTEWHLSTVAVTRTSMAPEDIQNDEPAERQVDVRHFAREEHISPHETWWRPDPHSLPIRIPGRRLLHLRFKRIEECQQSGHFYSIDRDGHGGSAFKRFDLEADGLHWNADLNEYGALIANKHKGAQGRDIPMSELRWI
jgi:hypothetical protein